MVLGRDLLIHDLDDVAHGDDTHERTVMNHGNLGDPPLAHLAHDVIDVIDDIAGDRIRSHHVRDPHSTEVFTSIMNDPEDVALGEDSHHPAIVIDDGQRSDIVLHQPGNRFMNRRFGIDRDDLPPLGLQDIADEHGASSPRQRQARWEPRIARTPLGTEKLDVNGDRILPSSVHRFNFFLAGSEKSRESRMFPLVQP